MHADQLTIPLETVRELVSDQFPRWRGLPVRAVRSAGTVNAIFRIGDRLAARFPLEARSAPDAGEVAATRRWLAAEAEAAAELSGRTRFPTPEPVALGEPGRGYPLPWSVQTWLPGVVAADELAADGPGGGAAGLTGGPLGESEGLAHDLAAFIADVRAIPTRGRTFRGGGRGGALTAHDEWVETCFQHSEGLVDVPRLRRIWAALRTLPRGDAPDVMSHTDLIPGNLLVAGGRLAGVLDVGGFGPADPALDLVGGWHLLEAGPRRVFRADLGCDDAEWARGKAWALAQAMGTVWYYRESNPIMSRMGDRTLARILADEG